MKQLSIQALAGKAGVSRSSIERIERGEVDADESFFTMGCRENRRPPCPRTRLHDNVPLVHELQQSRAGRSAVIVAGPSIADSAALRATAESDTNGAISVSHPSNKAAAGNGGTSR